MSHVPGHHEPATWLANAPAIDDVRAWIAASLPGHPAVSGPTTVLRAHAWGITARFAARAIPTAPQEDVVFKASFLPMEFPVAAPYRLLARCCPADVPELLAWADEPGRRWLLFRAFREPTAGNLAGISPVRDVAAAMARIQSLVAAMPPHALGSVPLGPVVPVGAVPAMLDRLIQTTEEHRGEPGLAPGVAARLASGRRRIDAWTRELDDGGWPTTIHHVDLHPFNAAIRPDGRALIYDWEEANLGFPFFSLDKLLLAAPERAAEAGVEAAVADVRGAYLDALPWGTRAEREWAFALAMRLSPIRFADADARFARALGWSAAEAVAPWVELALTRWGETS